MARVHRAAMRYAAAQARAGQRRVAAAGRPCSTSRCAASLLCAAVGAALWTYGVVMDPVVGR